MSIPVLTQVYDEVRRLSIAGSVVAAGDFRLKKLVPPLEQAGQKAPVFAKVAQAVEAVVESNEKTAAEALLGAEHAGQRHPLHAGRDRPAQAS